MVSVRSQDTSIREEICSASAKKELNLVVFNV